MRTRPRSGAVLAVLLALALGACGGDDDGGDDTAEGTTAATTVPPSPFSLTSPAFADGDAIPEQFTCDGDNVSPPLAWSELPAEIVDLALVVIDPDAPGGAFVHWLAWGIDPAAGSLAADAAPEGMVEGTNDTGQVGYFGPCPPPGDEPHRYQFKLFALRSELELTEGADWEAFFRAVNPVWIVQGSLEGTYARD